MCLHLMSLNVDIMKVYNSFGVQKYDFCYMTKKSATSTCMKQKRKNNNITVHLSLYLA